MLRPILVTFVGTALGAQQVPSFPGRLFEFPDDPFEFELLGDLDLDGDLDLVAFESAGPGLAKSGYSVRLLDGRKFGAGPASTLPPGTGAHTALADLDGDGRLDLVLSTDANHPLGRGFEVRRGQPGGAFAAPVHVAVGQDVLGMTVGDANGDAQQDLMLRYTWGPQIRLHWYLGSAQSLVASGPALGVAPATHSAVLDVDNDGFDDVALLANDGSAVTFVRTDGAQLTALVPIALPGGAARALLAIDWQNDGQQDLLAVLVHPTPGLDSLVRLTNLGTWSVGPAEARTEAPGASYHAGDWDGDGLTDVFRRRKQTPGTTYHFSDVLRNVGASFWTIGTATVRVPDTGSDRGVGIADLDQDGHADLIDNKAIHVGDGTFNFGTSYTQTIDSEHPVDWDGDGDLDLSWWRRNDGRGVFTNTNQQFPQAQAGYWYDVHSAPAGDLVGDGLYAWLVRRYQVPAFGWPVFLDTRLFREQPDGSIVDAGAAAPPGVALGTGTFFDADSDGDLDWLQPGGLFENDGTGFFTLAQPVANDLIAFVVGDLDGDAVDEVVARESTTNTLVVLRRTAPLTFASTPVFTPGGVVLLDPQLVDLDGDGDLDLCGVRDISGPGGEILLFQNDAGALSLVMTLAGGDRLATGDLDGDGRVDLCSHDSWNYGLHVYLGRPGQLGFETRMRTFLRQTQTVTALADLDLDGDTDLCGRQMIYNEARHGTGVGYRRQYGVGSPGSGDRRPILSFTGPVYEGLTAGLRVRHALGGSVAFVLVGDGEANAPSVVLPGVTSYVSGLNLIVGFGLDGAPGVAGVGGFDVSVPIPPGLAGTRLYFGAIVFDPGSPAAFTNTNGCELFVGF